MRETKIVHFNFYVGEIVPEFEDELNFEFELRNRIIDFENSGWEVDEVRIFEKKTCKDWYDIFLVLKRG